MWWKRKKKEEKEKNSIFGDIKKIIIFMKKTGVRFRFFVVSFIFSFGLTLFNLYTLALLFPLAEGIINSNFDHVANLKGVGSVVHAFPELFSTSLRLFVLLVVWVYMSIIFKNILSYLASISTDYQAKIAVSKLRNILVSKTLSFGKSFFDERNVGRLHHIILISSRTIEGQFSALKNLLVDSCLFIVFLAAMVKISWQLTIVSMITFPIMTIVTQKTIDKIRGAVQQSEKATFSTSDRVFNILNCIPVIKGFVKEKEEEKAFGVVNDIEMNNIFKAKRLHALIGPIEDIGNTTSVLFMAFGMALVIHLTGSIDPTGAFVFFYLAQRILPIIHSFNGFRLYAINAKREMDDILKILEGSEEYLINGGDKELTEFKDKIEIKNLNFTYPSGKSPVFSNLSLTIPKGKFTAIVGPTGSGKSTIINLLLRLYNVPKKSIYIDGVDITEFKPESVRKKISFVSQDSLLFKDTLLSNLSYGAQGRMKKNKVVRVSKEVAVHEIAQKMPKKYESMIEEGAANLSGGEKQRVSIARSIIKDSDILILDEATSALDGATEAKIIDAIENLAGDRTLIAISHRLSTIRKADHIIYIDNGAIAETGTRDELMAMKSKFYTQWELQKLK